MEILRFALMGLGTGAVYALLAQGLVLVYRGSGLLNFAQGAMAMVGAYAYYELTVEHGLPKLVGLIAALVVCAALGALIHLVVLRPMRRSSPLSRVIATLAVLVVLQSSAFLIYGHDPRAVPGVLPTRAVRLGSQSLVIPLDRIYIFVVAVLLTGVLYAVYRYTAIGRVTSAVAENQLAAASLGHSVDLVASVNWAIGSALGGLAGVLIAPIIFLEPSSLVLLVLPAMSAALIGRFASFPWTLAVCLLLGAGQSEILRYVDEPGWGTAAPFIAVIVVLVLRGSNLPLRSLVLDRLPAVGTGRVRAVPVLVLYLAGAGLLLASDPDWASAATATIGVGIIALSIVVITGYAGQLSLTQSVLGGIGALLAARLAGHMGFGPALVLAALGAAVLGAVIGLPALRTRGMTLAIVTLGLGAGLYAVVLSNSDYTGGVAGIPVPSPHLFGWNVDPFEFGNRYAFVAFTILVLLSLGVANLRRGSTGRRLLAVRSNERAAAALGVNNAAVKTYAFALAAAIAAVGGVLIAFQQSVVAVSSSDPNDPFTVVACILLVAVVVAGGVGYVGGAFVGALLVSGGILSKLLEDWSQVNDYLPLIGGLVLLGVLVYGPDGLYELTVRRLCRMVRRTPRPGARAGAEDGAADRPGPAADVRVRPLALHVDGLSVRYGGVRAVEGVDLDLRPGEVHGLIGPNGAGKTSLIDAITGFARAAEGRIVLGERDITGLPARSRARAGVARSFQSLELFTDLTVAENLDVAVGGTSWVRYLLDLVRPGRVRPSPAVRETMRRFGLLELADDKPGAISFGRRKAVAIARSVAARPSVLLLDEPAAGLDDRESAELAALIRYLATDWGIAVLLVEHKVDLIMSVSDRVTVLDRGSVLVSGSPAQVQECPAVMDAYLGVPA